MSLIAETANPVLDKALHAKLQRRSPAAGHLGVLELLAVRLGLLQHTLKPVFVQPQLVLFAADHGIAVDGLMPAHGVQTHEMVNDILQGRQPLHTLATQAGMMLSVVDCGLAHAAAANDRLQVRKIAHGSRNARVGAAMSIEQAHAAIRAGMEIGDTLRGNAVACAGLGVGSQVSAALMLARLTDAPMLELLHPGPSASEEWVQHLDKLGRAVLKRHAEVDDPVEVLAALGGFEIAMMVGVMLVAASKRHLVLVDGQAACAALLVASRIAHAVPDYCLFCRSTTHLGLDRSLALFQASVLLDLGVDALDGTGACLSWPLVPNATALLRRDDDASPSQPDGMEAPPVRSLYDPRRQDIPGVPNSAPMPMSEDAGPSTTA